MSSYFNMHVKRFHRVLLVMFLIIYISTMLTMQRLSGNVTPSQVEYGALNSKNVCGSVSLSLSLCPRQHVISDKSVTVNLDVLSYDELARLHGNDLSDGGHFRPSSCRSDQKVAIVIPYRDRNTNLKQLLNNLIPFLKRQNVDFHLFVAEQLPGSKFNRGMVKNIGFTEARKICDFDCVFFHDIDMMPIDNGNIYKCGDQPRHHSRNFARWHHQKPDPMSFGGVVSMRPEQFLEVNGYPNSYFDWGSEDDELGQRVVYHGMELTNYPFEISAYEEFTHINYRQYTSRLEYYYSWKERVNTDGLNSLHYTLKAVLHKTLFTHIFVDIDIETVRKAYNGEIVDIRSNQTQQGEGVDKML